MRANAFGPNDEQVVLVEKPRTASSTLVRNDITFNSRCYRLDTELRHGNPLTGGYRLVLGLVCPIVPRHCGSAWGSRSRSPSVLVPPMSKATTGRRRELEYAVIAHPTTPPAGPDSRARTPVNLFDATRPPSLFMKSQRSPARPRTNLDSNDWMYCVRMGETYASMAAEWPRGTTLGVDEIEEEREMCVKPMSCAMASARLSCSAI
jgi:hypothetical protein